MEGGAGGSQGRGGLAGRRSAIAIAQVGESREQEAMQETSGESNQGSCGCFVCVHMYMCTDECTGVHVCTRAYV